MSRRRHAARLLALIALAASPAGSEAKGPAATSLFPAGAAKGQSLEVAASGTFDRWPVRCWVDGGGLKVEAAEEKGKLKVEVAADAAPGVRWIRLYDAEGASSLRPFLVGVLPEIGEVEPNDDPRQPQALESARAVVNGRLAKGGDVDGFSVALESGDRLTADLEANRTIGSPMDGVLQVASTDGFVLEQNDDADGRDPRLVFQAPAKGTYVVRIFAFPAEPDSSIRFAGGDAYIYRLTLTTGGFVDHAFPPAVSRESPTPVAAVGPNVAEADVPLPPPDLTGDRRMRLDIAHPTLPGAAAVRLVPGPVVVEAEPNDVAQPQPIEVGATIAGRIDPPGDVDAYRIALKKGEKRTIRAESQALGLPVDPVLQVLDAEGKGLAEVDDARRGRDAQVDFEAPADGEYRVVVRDLNRRGGPRHIYLLGASAPSPDFELSLAADAFEVKPGEPTKVVVTVSRRAGFDQPVEVSAEGLPEGVSAAAVKSEPTGDSAKSVTLEIKSDAPAPPEPGPFRIVGRLADADQPPHIARAKVGELDAETEHPWLTVLPAPEAKKP